MNYIKKLEWQVYAEKERRRKIHEAIVHFKMHLLSPKFHTDTTIQVSDVHSWLTDIDALNVEEYP